ncbi:MAG: TIM barrel protein, partial [Oscillospiraceae bacterium]
MKFLMNMPLTDFVLSEYTKSELIDMCKAYKCDGYEVIWCDEKYKFDFPEEKIKGWHLSFYSDWVDFWKNDEKALAKKFGSKQNYIDFFGCKSKEHIINKYKEDLNRAKNAKAEYVVFHVSDVSVEETYTYKWKHTDEEVIDCAIEVINEILKDGNYDFYFLVENLHWSGFTFTNPQITKRLLDGISYKNKGIMLDIGHLMCTSTKIKTLQEAVSYIKIQLENHNDIIGHIKGIHLHQSLSGEYVSKNCNKSDDFIQKNLPKEYAQRFSVSYNHILNIDTHNAFTDENIAEIIKMISPEFVVHELSASNKKEKNEY